MCVTIDCITDESFNANYQRYLNSEGTTKGLKYLGVYLGTNLSHCNLGIYT